MAVQIISCEIIQTKVQEGNGWVHSFIQMICTPHNKKGGISGRIPSVALRSG